MVPKLLYHQWYSTMVPSHRLLDSWSIHLSMIYTVLFTSLATLSYHFGKRVPTYSFFTAIISYFTSIHESWARRIRLYSIETCKSCYSSAFYMLQKAVWLVFLCNEKYHHPIWNTFYHFWSHFDCQDKDNLPSVVAKQYVLVRSLGPSFQLALLESVLL